MLATLQPNGAILIPTAHGNITLEDGSYERLHGWSVIKVTRTVVGDFKLRAGRVLISNAKAGIYYIYKTMLTARRGLIHVVHNYGHDDMFSEEGEIRDLVTIIAANPNVLWQLANWKKITPAKITKLREAIAQLRDLMPDNPIDALKIETRRYLAKAETLHDSKGRPNPGVASNAAATAADRAAKRLEIVKHIVRLIDPRQVPVRREIANNWQRSHHVYVSLAGHNGGLGLIHNAQGIPDGTVPAPLIGQLNALIDMLEQGTDLPWVHAYERSLTDLRGARSLMQRGLTREAIKFMQRTAVAMEQHLTLLRPFADQLMDLSIDLRRRNPDPQAMAGHLAWFKGFLDRIPLQRDDQGKVLRDTRGEPIAQGDAVFRGGSVCVKMFNRIEDGILAWERGETKEAMAHIKSAEKVF